MDLHQCKKVIVFGGSFDPPHVAHVLLPSYVMRYVHADAVAYIPTGKQPLKTDQIQTPAHHRLAMLNLAVQGVDHACVLTDEIDRCNHADAVPSPTYTVDTLETLHHGLGKGVTMQLLIGGDQLRVFDRWRNPKRIVELASPLVMIRPPDTRQSLLSSLPDGFDPGEWEARLVDVPRIDVSSTQIRDRVAQGQSIYGLVPLAVEAYIHEHHLYA